MSDGYEPTQEQFLKDVAGHRLEVLLDSGTHRHLRFRAPGTTRLWFDVVTWPDAATIEGDMGTYVFRRDGDMLEFFRRDPRQRPIDPRYWEEKLAAADGRRGDPVREYSEAMFREAVLEELEEFLYDRADDPDLRRRVEAEVLAYADSRDRAVEAAEDFRHEGRKVFSDFGENNLDGFTYRYIWCCRALAWAAGRWFAAGEGPEDAEDEGAAA